MRHWLPKFRVTSAPDITAVLASHTHTLLLVTPEMPGTTATMPWAAPLSQLLGTACMALNSGVTHTGHSVGLSLRFVLLGTKADFTPFIQI